MVSLLLSKNLGFYGQNAYKRKHSFQQLTDGYNIPKGVTISPSPEATTKMHRKILSAEVSYLLHVNAYVKDKFQHTDKQCGSRSDCS